MNKTNISSVVEFEAKDSMKIYMERINEHPNVHEMTVDEMNQTKNVFSGEERKILFDMKNHDTFIPVRVYFTFPATGNNGIMMDIFSSTTDYVDIFEYEETLTNLLKDVIQDEFLISFSSNRVHKEKIKA